MNEEKTTHTEEVRDTSNFSDLSEEESKRPIWIVILAVAGILAVLIALGIGIVQLASKGSDKFGDLTTGFGSIFSGQERIILTANQNTVNSGDAVTMTIEHKNQKASNTGIYAIKVECTDGIKAVVDGKSVACGEVTELSGDTTSLVVSLETNKTRYTDIPISISFMGSKDTIETNTLLTIVNTSIDSTVATDDTENGSESTPGDSTTEGSMENETPSIPSTPTYVTVKRYVGRYSNPNGTADLNASVQNVGVIRNGEFRTRDEVRKNERAAVAFTVTNKGTKETGLWYFSAILPTKDGAYYYTSDAQPTLLPGDRIEYVLAFDDIDGKDRTSFYISVDPTNSIKELSKTNNFAEAIFNVVR